jgi:hypothetical protein
MYSATITVFDDNNKIIEKIFLSSTCIVRLDMMVDNACDHYDHFFIAWEDATLKTIILQENRLREQITHDVNTAWFEHEIERQENRDNGC